MSKLAKYIKRKIDLIELFSIYRKQPWLLQKDGNLAELFKMCSSKKHKSLLVNLLENFNFLNGEELSGYLNSIAEYIIKESKFTEAETQIAAITFDDEADSSQKILDQIKMPLFRKGWSNIKTVNRYGAIKKNYDRGYKQIILIDEFIGSGQTLLNRIKQLKNDIKEDFEIKICFIAGMDYAIKLIEEAGYEIFCPLKLPKGIRERFIDKSLDEAINSMIEIEETLAPNINEHALTTYSFGYNTAEALYSLEGCQGNTPNSVFPIFWWPRHKNGKERNTLLTRFQKGLK